MADKAFLDSAILHGFTSQQAAFLLEHVAQRPHTHTSDEVIVDPEDGETLEEFREAVIDAVFEDAEETEEVER